MLLFLLLYVLAFSSERGSFIDCTQRGTPIHLRVSGQQDSSNCLIWGHACRMISSC